MSEHDRTGQYQIAIKGLNAALTNLAQEMTRATAPLTRAFNRLYVDVGAQYAKDQLGRRLRSKRKRITEKWNKKAWVNP